MKVSTAATVVTITASDGAPGGPLSARVLTDRVAVAQLANIVNHLQPAPLTPVIESYCGNAPPLRIDVVFTGSHMTPANFVVTPLLSTACNTTWLIIGARKGPIVEAGNLAAKVVSLLPVPLLSMFKESATLAAWPPDLISHYSLADRAGA